jgi:hypothetical protein
MRQKPESGIAITSRRPSSKERQTRRPHCVASPLPRSSSWSSPPFANMVGQTAHERNGTPEPNDKDLISTQVARVDVESDHLAIRLAITPEQQSGKKVESDVLNHAAIAKARA